MLEMKNLHKAALRIRKAVKEKERIILYGDGDLDGVSSVLILQEALRNLGGNVVAKYFPDREKEGYGITRTAIEKLKSFAPALLVTCDLGIGNIQEVPLAIQEGFDVLIIDHHETSHGLPQGALIVDPKQEGETYPFHDFAACGLCFLLADALFENKMPPPLRQSLIELAALGTIADMMPRQEDNLLLIEEGTDAIFQSWRPGIRAFFDMQPFGKTESRNLLIDQMISVLNARDVQEGSKETEVSLLPAAYRLLTASSSKEARMMIGEFIEKNRVRKEKVRAIVQEVRKRIALKNEDSLIFEGDKTFDYELLGTAASILEREHKKPIFLYKEGEEMSLGSVRAPHGYLTVNAMKACSSLLHTFGGHQQASGFRVENDRREQLKQCLHDYFKEHAKEA